MNMCPEDRRLVDLLEEKLNRKEQGFMVRHLRNCQICREKLQEIVNDEKTLIQAALASPGRQTVKNLKTQECPSDIDLLKYIYNVLPLNKEHIMEDHLSRCPRCVKALMRLQKEHVTHQILDLDLSFLMPEDLRQAAREDSILEIILKVKQNNLELFGHSEANISFLPDNNLDESDSESFKQKVVLEKDFRNLNISLKVSINQNLKTLGPPITVSALKTNTNTIVSDLALSTIKKKPSPKNYADIEGNITLNDTKKGQYGVWKADKLVARIRIK